MTFGKEKPHLLLDLIDFLSNLVGPLGDIRVYGMHRTLGWRAVTLDDGRSSGEPSGMTLSALGAGGPATLSTRSFGADRANFRMTFTFLVSTTACAVPFVLLRPELFLHTLNTVHNLREGAGGAEAAYRMCLAGRWTRPGLIGSDGSRRLGSTSVLRGTGSPRPRLRHHSRRGGSRRGRRSGDLLEFLLVPLLLLGAIRFSAEHHTRERTLNLCLNFSNHERPFLLHLLHHRLHPVELLNGSTVRTFRIRQLGCKFGLLLRCHSDKRRKSLALPLLLADLRTQICSLTTELLGILLKRDKLLSPQIALGKEEVKPASETTNLRLEVIPRINKRAGALAQ